MLDSAYVRDHVDAVRTGLRNRGLDPDKALEEIATLETARRRMIPELEGLKRQQNTSGDEIARAKRQGHDTTPVQEANRARAQQIKQLSVTARCDRAAAHARADGAAEPAARERAGGRERRRQRRGAAASASRARSTSSRSRTGSSARRSASSTSSARTQDRRRAVLRAVRRRRAAVARADQLHARPAHARARLSRGRAAVPGQHARR